MPTFTSEKRTTPTMVHSTTTCNYVTQSNGVIYLKLPASLSFGSVTHWFFPYLSRLLKIGQPFNHKTKSLRIDKLALPNNGHESVRPISTVSQVLYLKTLLPETSNPHKLFRPLFQEETSLLRLPLQLQAPQLQELQLQRQRLLPIFSIYFNPRLKCRRLSPTLATSPSSC